MLRALLTLLAFTLLSSCSQLEAVAPPYFDGLFFGYYLTGEAATPVGMRLELRASDITAKRYTITGGATIGDETFSAEGYELAPYNLDYLTPQSPPPPTGNTVIAIKDEAGATAYTLCADVIYRDYDNSFRVDRMTLLEGALADGDENTYCAPYSGFASVELRKY